MSKGLDVILDEWDLERFDDDLELFMESGIRDSDFVIIVSTPTYVRKANKREGGVGIENTIITGEYFEKGKKSKYIPVIRKGSKESKDLLPTYLKSKFYIDFRDNEKYEENLENVIRKIYGIPKIKKPKPGKKPDLKSIEPIGNIKRLNSKSYESVDLFSQKYGGLKPVETEISLKIDEAEAKELISLLSNKYSIGNIYLSKTTNAEILRIFITGINLNDSNKIIDYLKEKKYKIINFATSDRLKSFLNSKENPKVLISPSESVSQNSLGVLTFKIKANRKDLERILESIVEFDQNIQVYSEKLGRNKYKIRISNIILYQLNELAPYLYDKGFFIKSYGFKKINDL